MRWSFSKLGVYENCAYRYKLKYIDKVPEPEQPLPKGKSEHANDRGSRVHEGNEIYVKGESDFLPSESESFTALIDDLRERYQQGIVLLEHDWCFNGDWEPCSEEEREAITIVDFAVWLIPDKWLLIGDYKTGNQYPAKHADQMQLYALAGFKRYPYLERITTELWYLDKDDIATMHHKPTGVGAIQRAYRNRVGKMERDTEFKPASHVHACKWCPYNPSRGGECPFAYDEKQAKPNGWESEWKL